jgi:hypothetical protein
VPDPLAGALEVAAADPAADVLGEAVVLDDDEPDEHPPISAATAATATAPIARRARSSLDMVLITPPREKGPRADPRLIRAARLKQNVSRTAHVIKVSFSGESGSSTDIDA